MQSDWPVTIVAGIQIMYTIVSPVPTQKVRSCLTIVVTYVLRVCPLISEDQTVL